MARTGAVPLEDGIIYTHSDCVCNEVLALTNRHQVGGNAFERGRDVGLRRVMDEMVAQIRGFEDELTVASRAKIVGLYSGAKRRQFDMAMASLETKPIEHKDSTVSMFLKDDKYAEGALKAPRCIQYRSKRYCLELGRYLHPIEHATYQLRDWTGSRIIAKSRNSFDRARDLLRKAEQFDDPAFVLLDHSKWDAHCLPELLKVEHYFYQSIFPSRKLARLLKWQLDNVGYTKHGTKYRTPGTRMSGDMNTGLGNSVLNYALLEEWLVRSLVRGSVYVDGDDSVIVVERADVARLLSGFGGAPAHFAKYGMDTNNIKVADEFSQCEFCQCKPVFDGDRWRMVRDPERIKLRTMWTTRKYTAEATRSLIYSVGMCEAVSNSGMPVGQALGLAMMSYGGNLLANFDRSFTLKLEGPQKFSEPTPQARDSYADAWGVSVEGQLELEARLSLFVPGSTTISDVESYWAAVGGM